VFLVGIAESLIFALKDGAYILEGAVAVLMSLVLTFALQGVVAFGGCAVVWRVGRNWVWWMPIDYVAAVVPWCCWALLGLLAPTNKSLVNILYEGVLIGFAAPLAALLKLSLARWLPAVWSTGLSLCLGAVLAFALWRLVPFLGE